MSGSLRCENLDKATRLFRFHMSIHASAQSSPLSI